METEQLKLTADHFPLPCSLRESVLHRYTTLASTALGMQAMDTGDLVRYLRSADHLELTPMQSVLAQAEVLGDPAMPAADHVAILSWLGEAFNQWEADFPLEEPLASQLRRLKPLAATLAISNQDFLTPGGHPLHLMLDNLQLAAIGWQPRLGRVGEGLRKQLFSAVEEALTWFDTQDVDLSALCARVVAATERDLARASRMTQRTIETEQGRFKKAEAKRVAADMINAALQDFGIPQGIGTFLRGPWYDSAQLVLLKFGAESEEWSQMSETTATLVDSLQAVDEEEDPQRRQHLFETVTRLPRELKRWLLSMQHFDDSVDEAIKMIEFAHMEILRKHPLELESTELIPIAAAQTDASAQRHHESIRTDQWFHVDTGDGNPLRVRLVSPVDGPGELLFANQAGIRVFQQSLDEFAQLVDQGKVLLLDSGASFSRSLTRAAGIETSADLDSLLGDAVVLARREEAERKRLEEERPQREQELAQRLENEREEAARLRQEDEDSSRLARESESAEKAAHQLQIEDLEAEELQREWDEALRRKQERESPTQAPQVDTASTQPQPTRQAPEQPAPGAAPEAYEWVEPEGLPEKIPDDLPEREADPVSREGSTKAPSATDLPMGTWLGFHDGDTPLLAKLAVHDREQNTYIFVNRSGIKMRQLSQAELSALVENGLVDVLETRSNFKDEISKAKEKSGD